ncbi:YCF48-related protein [Haliscomenobacter sp.]|uniref:YCF48-related protein n=1 Tax=Haliscomenobacter sp. TaxID=2717303 RepID=UPI003593FD89
MKNKFLLFFLLLLQSPLINAQNWQKLTPVSSPTPESSPQWGFMSVVNADTAWFADPFGVVTRTLDGGKTWNTNFISVPEDVFLDYYLGSFFAADAQQAFTVWFNFDGTSTLNFRTTDGGETWNPAFPNGEFNELGSFLNGIHFFSPSTALAWGDPVRDTFEMYRTIDGGNTWSRMKAPRALSNEISYFSAYDTQGDTIWIGTVRGRVLKSNDQGRNWSVVSLPTAIDIGSIALNNGHEGALSVLGGNIWLTSDGGSNWTQGTRRSVDRSSPNRIFSIKKQPDVYLSSNEFEGWADLSFDKCKSWSISLLQPGVASLSNVKFIDAQTAWAIHNDSTVLKWTNPPVLFDPVEPDYTAIKSKHASGIPTSGARLALWSAPAGSYGIEHKLLKNGNALSTLKENLALQPKQVSASYSKAALSGKGNYMFQTTLLNNNTIEQQHVMNLIVGDSVFAKDSDHTVVGVGESRGNFIDLLAQDTLTSITAKVYVDIPSRVSFWVYGFNPITRRYDQRLFSSAPIQLTPKDTIIVFGNDSLTVPVPVEWITFKLPSNLILNPGRYAVGLQYVSGGGSFQMDGRKVSKQALFVRTLNRVDSIVGYAFAPMIRANFNNRNLIVSVKDPDLAVGIKVFPNPSYDWLSFDLPDSLPERLGGIRGMFLRLFNQNGQETYRQMIHAGLSTVRVDHLPQGVYLWQISGRNGKVVAGMVVKK